MYINKIQGCAKKDLMFMGDEGILADQIYEYVSLNSHEGIFGKQWCDVYIRTIYNFEDGYRLW